MKTKKYTVAQGTDTVTVLTSDTPITVERVREWLGVGAECSDSEIEDSFFAIEDMDDFIAEYGEHEVIDLDRSELLSQFRREFARSGGSVKTEKKAAASRENGKKGGRPKKLEKV